MAIGNELKKYRAHHGALEKVHRLGEFALYSSGKLPELRVFGLSVDHMTEYKALKSKASSRKASKELSPGFFPRAKVDRPSLAHENAPSWEPNSSRITSV